MTAFKSSVGAVSPLTTAEFVQELQSKNEKAFSHLYDAYSPYLFFLIKKIVRSQSPAEDVLQNAFIKIWANIHTYSPLKGSLFTWMFSITRNECIDYCRSRYARASSLTCVLSENVIVTVTSVEPALTQPDLLRSLHKFPYKERAIIQLYTMGFTCREIGKLLSLPEGTVKTKMRGIYKKLRLVLA